MRGSWVCQWPEVCTFRWPLTILEAALAHVVRNKVEAAYWRTDLFERRRWLMDDWAAYVISASHVGRGVRSECAPQH